MKVQSRAGLPTKKVASRRFARRHITLFKQADELIAEVRPYNVRISVTVEVEGQFYTYNSTSDNWPPDPKNIPGDQIKAQYTPENLHQRACLTASQTALESGKRQRTSEDDQPTRYAEDQEDVRTARLSTPPLDALQVRGPSPDLRQPSITPGTSTIPQQDSSPNHDPPCTPLHISGAQDDVDSAEEDLSQLRGRFTYPPGAPHPAASPSHSTGSPTQGAVACSNDLQQRRWSGQQRYLPGGLMPSTSKIPHVSNGVEPSQSLMHPGLEQHTVGVSVRGATSVGNANDFEEIVHGPSQHRRQQQQQSQHLQQRYHSPEGQHVQPRNQRLPQHAHYQPQRQPQQQQPHHYHQQPQRYANHHYHQQQQQQLQQQEETQHRSEYQPTQTQSSRQDDHAAVQQGERHSRGPLSQPSTNWQHAAQVDDSAPGSTMMQANDASRRSLVRDRLRQLSGSPSSKTRKRVM